MCLSSTGDFIIPEGITHDSRLVRAVFAALRRLAGLTRVLTAEDKHAFFFTAISRESGRALPTIDAWFFDGMQPSCLGIAGAS